MGERTWFFTIFSYGRKIQKPSGFNLVEIWLTTYLFVCFCSLWYYDVALAWRWNIDPSKEDVKIFVLAKYPTPATMVMGKRNHPIHTFSCWWNIRIEEIRNYLAIVRMNMKAFRIQSYWNLIDKHICLNVFAPYACFCSLCLWYFDVASA